MQNILKQTSEVKTVSVDFSSVLSAGETINSSNYTIVAKDVVSGITVGNLPNGTTVENTVLDFDSDSLSGNKILFKVKNGFDDFIYKIIVNTGSTSGGQNIHEEDIFLAVSSDLPLLTTVDELKRYLNITSTTNDVLLFELVKAATAFLEDATRRTFSFKERIEDYLPLESDTALMLKIFPVESITSVIIDGVTLASTTASRDNYIVLDGGVLQRVDGGSFPKAPFKTVVKYKAGFKAIPEDIRHAVKKIAAEQYNLRLKEGIQRESVGGYNVTFKSGDSIMQNPGIAAVIQRYRLRLF